MRMLLTSNGLSEPVVLDALVDLLGRPIAESRIVVVIDAILGFPGDSSTLVDHLASLRALGWAELDVASLHAGPQALVASRLRAADVILGYGGSNVWLAHTWAATGLAPLLRELLDEKVYVGWSAGSMIFTRALPGWGETFRGQAELDMFGLDPVEPAVSLFDWVFLGHLDADWMPEGAEERAARGAARSGATTWFLDDASALVIRDPDAEPVVVSAGRWLRFGPDGGVEARGEQEATGA